LLRIAAASAARFLSDTLASSDTKIRVHRDDASNHDAAVALLVAVAAYGQDINHTSRQKYGDADALWAAVE
jgi:hypothetical protein